ncbi:hypothetical protein [Paenibacillus silvae]|uniref:Uncharacterized protein n=1 Tax=Paenibacillus silvae TaxID=1325358 RepID=A0A2W6NNH7_9BACL|nr:hypothetical protein [Paenibacillus silvae]PZT57402.1 hypothetical protein DN757_01730 [Paenibacillus silvae]
MSYQETTTNKEAVSEIVRDILKDEDHPNTELLIYFEDGEWSITKDKRFYSYGLKVEDKVKHLEGIIESCIKELQQFTRPIDSDDMGEIVNGVMYDLKIGMQKYQDREIEWSN